MKEHGLPEEAPAAAAAPAASDELSEWLKKIGGDSELLDYVPALKKEGFGTIEAVKNLEEDDFDALGISKRGHRKTLLAGVAALKGKTA